MKPHEAASLMHHVPKVELHVHLEGATDAETVWVMAQRNGVTLSASSLEEWKDQYQFRDFEHFIEIYGLATSVMRRPEDWSFMVERFLSGQAQQNIVYTEAFLSASYQVSNLPADEWIDAIAEGAAIGERQHGAKVRFIPDISRHLPDTQEAVLQHAIEACKREHFIGLGLGGIEAGFPADLFIETFREAKRRGLRIVAHAGETTGAQTIRDAVHKLGAERIGHGIRCLTDADLVNELREKRIPMEVCPTSNYCLGVVERGQPHPLRRMVDAGLYCTVNSDDPPMFSTTLNDEYSLLAIQGFSIDELQQLNLNAVDASFLPDDEKLVMRSKIEAAYSQ
ncbi:MAG: adenosine deaminase [Planctomycetaceae bacterium]|nr:adenosine deaminase [Planctomycetaceae bacterium]